MSAQLNQVLQVVAKWLNQKVEYVDAVVHHKTRQHEEHAQGKTQLRQSPDSSTYSRDSRSSGKECNAPYDDDL